MSLLGSPQQATVQLRPFLDPHRLLDAPVASAGLKRTSVRGAASTGAGQVATLALRFGATAVLARLLTPEDYGLVAMTAVITGFVGLFKDAGLTSATIQREQITHGQISTLFWVNAALGGVIAGILVAVSPGVAAFYAEPRLVGVTCGLAVTFVFGGLTVQHQALLRRQMRFGRLAWLEIGSTAVGVCTGIVMASWGFGYWALVGMAIGTAVASALGVWMAVPWRPGLARRGSGAMPMLRFGSDVLSFNILNYFARQADNILIGRFWGAAALGVYDRAYGLLMLPIAQINSPLAAVAVPALSRARADAARFTRYFVGMLQLLASVTTPMVVALAIFAEEVVLIWLGPNWLEAATLFRLLGAAALVRAITNPVGWLLISLGQTRRYRQLGLFNSVIIVLSFVVGLPYGPAGVASAYSIAMCALLVPTWWFVLQGTEIRLGAVFGALTPPFLACIPAAAAGYYVANMSVADWPRWVSVFGGATAFGGLYTAVLLVGFQKWTFFRGIVRELGRAHA